MIIGALEDGGLFSVQVEGGQKHGAGLPDGHMPSRTKKTTSGVATSVRPGGWVATFPMASLGDRLIE
jgi:hypothetical protein